MILIRRVYWDDTGLDCLVFIKKDNDPTIKMIDNNSVPNDFELLDCNCRLSISGKLINPKNNYNEVDLDGLVNSVERII